jgi:hypothetical protein
MADFILFMHDDATPDPAAWGPYFSRLNAAGVFQGGSAIGSGVCMRKDGRDAALTERLSGYIRLEAESLEAARTWVEGNPVFEAGGTVELRELPRS